MRLEAPLDPSADEARRLLQRELATPEYYDDNLVERVLGWLQRRVDGAVDGSRDMPALTWFAITVVVTVLVAAAVLLVVRARGTAREARRRDTAVLSPEALSSAELRSRAERALAQGRHAEAVVEAFRALARRQVERGRLDDAPGVTAHEVAAALAAQYPAQRARTAAGADVFDAVMYGERPATRDQAVAVLDLDRELAGGR